MTVRPMPFLATMTGLLLSGTFVLAEPLFKSSHQANSSGSQLQAQGGPNPSERPPREGKWLEQLNLSDTQKEQLAQIRSKYQAQMSQSWQRSRAEKQALLEMMAGTNSTDEIRAQQQKVVGSQQELGNLRFESMLEMREVLTPQQRRELAQLMEQHRAKFRDRFERRRERNEPS